MDTTTMGKTLEPYHLYVPPWQREKNTPGSSTLFVSFGNCECSVSTEYKDQGCPHMENALRCLLASTVCDPIEVVELGVEILATQYGPADSRIRRSQNSSQQL